MSLIIENRRENIWKFAQISWQGEGIKEYSRSEIKLGNNYTLRKLSRTSFQLQPGSTSPASFPHRSLLHVHFAFCRTNVCMKLLLTQRHIPFLFAVCMRRRVRKLKVELICDTMRGPNNQIEKSLELSQSRNVLEKWRYVRDIQGLGPMLC